MVDPRLSAIAKKGWETQRDPAELDRCLDAKVLREQGMTYRQIAEQQGISVDKARNRVLKAESRIRRERYNADDAARKAKLLALGFVECPCCGEPVPIPQDSS